MGTEDTTEQSSEKNVLDGEGAEKGVLVSKRMSLSSRKKNDDPFGGDDFGGDVFAVGTKNETTEEAELDTDKNGLDNTDASGAATAKDGDSNSNEKLAKNANSVGNDSISSSNIEPSSNKEPNDTRTDKTDDIMTSKG